MINESKLFLDKIKDLIRIRDLRNIPKFTAFLTPSEASIVASTFKEPNCLFFGGYPEAERRMFGALPEYIEDFNAEFPITALKFEYRKVDKLSHRDFLGSFMATGISRETIGDIRIGKGCAVAFVCDDIADYLVNQITKIGRVGVSVQKISLSDVTDYFEQPKTVPLSFTVSSLRLDAVLSGLVGCSRNKAESFVKEGLVFVNSFEVLKVTKQVKSGDFITLRGTGKFLITSCNGLTKKGREIITAEKYI